MLAGLFSMRRVDPAEPGRHLSRRPS